jgi:hypothetical protein
MKMESPVYLRELPPSFEFMLEDEDREIYRVGTQRPQDGKTLACVSRVLEVEKTIIEGKIVKREYWRITSYLERVFKYGRSFSNQEPVQPVEFEGDDPHPYDMNWMEKSKRKESEYLAKLRAKKPVG